MKEVKKDLNNWTGILYSWAGRRNIKRSVLPNLNDTYNAIPMKMPANCFVDINKWIVSVYEKAKAPKPTKH